MPSEAAKRRKEKKKAQAKGKPANAATSVSNGVSQEVNSCMENLSVSSRACTGVLASHPEARDLHIHQFSITFHGAELLADTKLEINCGRRYGLIGSNGCGKLMLNQLAVVSM